MNLTPEQREKLKAAAERMIDCNWKTVTQAHDESQQWHRAAEPAVILALLAELAEKEAALSLVMPPFAAPASQRNATATALARPLWNAMDQHEAKQRRKSDIWTEEQRAAYRARNPRSICNVCRADSNAHVPNCINSPKGSANV